MIVVAPVPLAADDDLALGAALLPMTLALPFKTAKRRLLEEFERRYVLALARRHPANLSRASRETGLSRRHLRHLLRKHSLYRAPGGAP